MRSYATVSFLNRTEHGLLDTGANVSCVGASFASQDFVSFPEFKPIKSNVQTADGKGHENQTSFPDIKIIDKRLYKRTEHASGDTEQEKLSWKLWVPVRLRDSVLKQAHDSVVSSHGGIQKTLEKIRRHLFWLGLAADVREYIRNCDICKSTKAPNYTLRPPMGDHCPTVQTIVSDNGSQFKAGEFNALLTKLGISHVYTALYSPQSNAAERVNRSLLAAVRSYINQDHREWDIHLTEISCALRSSLHQSLGCSPYRVLFGMDMITHGKDYKLLKKLTLLEEPITPLDRSDNLAILRRDIQQNIRKAYDKNVAQYNLRARPKTAAVVRRPVTRRLARALEAGSDVEVANPQTEGLNGSNTSNPTDAAVPPPVIRQRRGRPQRSNNNRQNTAPDYAVIQSMIEQSVSRMLASMQITPLVAPFRQK
ncbi:hypothetical protein ACLKA6_000639 [Drosophila palustris]